MRKEKKESLSEEEEAILTIGKKIIGMIEMLDFAAKKPARMEAFLDLFPKINLEDIKQ